SPPAWPTAPPNCATSSPGPGTPRARWSLGTRAWPRPTSRPARPATPTICSTESIDPVPKSAPLQFGAPEPDTRHRDRPAVFGIAERAGQIALIRVTREGVAPFHDLPGGAIEPGESEGRALAREFGEETGLVVKGGEILDYADQYMVKSDGEPVNNRSVLMVAVIEGFDPSLKIEDDHKLAWL